MRPAIKVQMTLLETIHELLHSYEVRPRKDKRGVDLISDVLPFGRLWYDGRDGFATPPG
jgi:hypothetical protein